MDSYKNMENVVLKLYSDIGMGEIFMSRLFHFQERILPGLFELKNTKEIKESILIMIFDCFEPAFRSLKNLRKEWNNDKIPERKKHQDIENIYSYLERGFQDRFRKIAGLMGYNINFFFVKENKFISECKKFEQEHPVIGKDITNLIKNDRKIWYSLMNKIRNDYIEHSSTTDELTKNSLKKFMNLETAETIFDNCWRAIEDFLMLFSIDKINPKFGMELLELKEYQENKNHPERFGWFMTDKTIIN